MALQHPLNQNGLIQPSESVFLVDAAQNQDFDTATFTQKLNAE